jgi:thiamine biosynthesis lipoprotein
VKTSTWSAFGCDVIVGGELPPAELMAMRSLFDRRDQIFSRFRTDSELNLVNNSPAPQVIVSGEFAAMLTCALAAAHASRGLVDPTLGHALLAAGYDRDFAAITESDVPAGPPAISELRSVRLTGRLLSRPPGLQLDLNGVVKAETVDRALALAPSAVFVSAGGDIAARSAVDVELPGGEVVCLRRGGLATSSTGRRRWRRGGRWQHHLIDPRTGLPASSCWQDVTVSATSCLQADIAAKTGLLLGDHGPDWLTENGLPARLRVSSGDTIVHTPAWPQQQAVAACI